MEICEEITSLVFAEGYSNFWVLEIRRLHGKKKVGFGFNCPQSGLESTKGKLGLVFDGF